MPYLIDFLINNRVKIDDTWYISRPLPGPFVSRLKDAWEVLWGRADVVIFKMQEK